MEGESVWGELSFISVVIMQRFEEESFFEGFEIATRNLYMTLRATLKALFRYLDDGPAKMLLEEELYYLYLKSYLEMAAYEIEEDHILFKFKKEVLNGLLLRKETFQEIVTFNKVSKGTKLSYKSFKLQMDEQINKNSGMHKFGKKGFFDLWDNVDESRAFKLLEDFIALKPDFGLESVDGKYRYDSNQSHSGVKMAGFLVALSEGGWIKIFSRKSSEPIYDGKTLTRIINEFFGCNLAEKGEPFQKANLDNLRDKLSLYPSRVEPILKIIGINNF
ncbi:hypothetical protein [Pedobacter jamesrossensis]|uniref:RteC protein n=1 Tax=Pedobacter jamesrossensis TaxID=1908238 RepID=A0ABV8NJ02_9SPHI